MFYELIVASIMTLCVRTETRKLQTRPVILSNSLSSVIECN